MYETILDQSCDEARKFFLREKSYCNFDMPPYIKFESLLNELDDCEEIPDKVPDSENNGQVRANRLLTSVFRNIPKDKVNYELFTNKDGKFSWRPLEFINPIGYVYLVKIITEKDAWNEILDRFNDFKRDTRIVCCSLPLVHEKPNQKAKNITNWYENFEKETIKQSLNYEYMFMTDISNCYSSIYTHSIAWALHPEGEQGAKNNRYDVRLICNAVDNIVQQLSYGQTDGIPQGSVLMDFIAEIVLGYADLLLSEKIKEDKEIKRRAFYIMRYRDDYRIFAKTKNIAERIARYLSEVLAHLNLRLNPDKTILTDDIITDAQKSDKLFWNNISKSKDLNTRALQVHSLSKKYPNSGSVTKGLTEIYDMIEECKNITREDLWLIFSIVVDIAYHNPHVYPIVIGIIGLILSKYSKKDKEKLIKSTIEKIKTVPNSEYFNIWVQRLYKEIPLRILGEGQFCDYIRKNIDGKGMLRVNLNNIWNCSALLESQQSNNSNNSENSNETSANNEYDKIKNIMDNASIFDYDEYKDMKKYPAADEIKVFDKYF